MRICLLTNQNLLADPFPVDDWPCDPRPFYPDAHWEVECLTQGHGGRAGDASRRAGLRCLLQSLRRRRGPGHTRHRGRAHARAAWRSLHRRDVGVLRALARGDEAGLPRRGHRHAGVRPRARTGRRRACRRGARAFRSSSSTTAAIRASISPGARASSSPAGLRRQADKIMRRHGAALIEEFIEGTEVTVLVAENPDDPSRPKTYTPMQYRFPDGETFKHSRHEVGGLRQHDGLSGARSGARCPRARRLRALLSRARRRELRPLRSAHRRATARHTCWRSTPTAASTTCPRTRAAPTSACCTIRKATPDSRGG